MIVQLLQNLKINVNEVQDRGKIFEGTMETFPEWLQIEITRKKNVKILSDITPPIPVIEKKVNEELKAKAVVTEAKVIVTEPKEEPVKKVEAKKITKPKTRIIKRKL